MTFLAASYHTTSRNQISLDTVRYDGVTGVSWSMPATTSFED